MPTKDNTKIKKETQLKVKEIFKAGPKVPRIKDREWDFLVYELKKLKVTPGEAYRIIAEKKGDTNIRFQWKMIRLTLFVWERVKEDRDKMFLKPKIDTVREVVSSRRFKEFFYGYFPDLEFDHEKEVRLLNKLISEKPQTEKNGFLSEGYYFYERTKETIPQKHLDKILWGKIKE